MVIAQTQKFWVVLLERLSFLLWIGFTIFSVALIGIGVMSILYAGVILIGSGALPARLPLVDTRWAPAALSATSLALPLLIIGAGIAASFFSLIWRQIGIDHFHYSEMDLLVSSREAEETLSSRKWRKARATTVPSPGPRPKPGCSAMSPTWTKKKSTWPASTSAISSPPGGGFRALIVCGLWPRLKRRSIDRIDSVTKVHRLPPHALLHSPLKGASV
jgi:hypothetical protein